MMLMLVMTRKRDEHTHGSIRWMCLCVMTPRELRSYQYTIREADQVRDGACLAWVPCTDRRERRRIEFIGMLTFWFYLIVINPNIHFSSLFDQHLNSYFFGDCRLGGVSTISSILSVIRMQLRSLTNKPSRSSFDLYAICCRYSNAAYVILVKRTIIKSFYSDSIVTLTLWKTIYIVFK